MKYTARVMRSIKRFMILAISSSELCYGLIAECRLRENDCINMFSVFLCREAMVVVAEAEEEEENTEVVAEGTPWRSLCHARWLEW